MAPVSSSGQLTPAECRELVWEKMEMLETITHPPTVNHILKNCHTRILRGLWAINGIDPDQEAFDLPLAFLCGFSLMLEKIHYEEQERIGRALIYQQLEFDL